MKAKMYRFIFSIFLVCFAAISKAQTIDWKLYTPFNNYYQWIGGKFNSNLNIPKIAATTGRDTGGIRYNLVDSSVYVWTGSQWVKVGGSNLTFSNGLTKSGDDVKLGGTLTENTTIKGSNARSLTIDSLSSFLLRTDDNTQGYKLWHKNVSFFGTNPSINQTYITTPINSTVSIGLTGTSLGLSRALTNSITLQSDTAQIVGRMSYLLDPSSGFTRFSLVHKQYVDNLGNTKVNISDTSLMLSPYIRTASNGLTKFGQDVKLGGTLTENTTIKGINRNLTFDTINQFIIKTNDVSPNFAIGENIGATISDSYYGGSLSNSGSANVELLADSNTTQNTISLLSIKNVNKNSQITIGSDSIIINPYQGIINIDTLASTTDTLTHKPVVYDESTKRLKYKTNWNNTDTATVVKAYVTNAEAVTITKGQVVYIFGAQGDRAAVKLAKNTSDTFSSKTLGIVRADIAAGQAGWVTTQGQVSGINLGAYTAGDILWLDSVAGGFTKTKPIAPKHGVFIGVVERANAGNGIIYVKPQNGVELDEIHNVLITSPTNNQVLSYTASTGIWENKSVTTALGYTPVKINIRDTISSQKWWVKDSLPITTARRWALVVDTSTNRIERQNLNIFRRDQDTVPLAVFNVGSAAAGDTAAFSTSTLAGSFYLDGTDTMFVTSYRVALQGTSASITPDVWFNDSLNVTAGGTKLVNSPSAITNLTTGTSVTPDTNKIPPGNFVFVRFSAVTTKPTYFTLTLFGYRIRKQ